jgi:hypothetical protein
MLQGSGWVLVSVLACSFALAGCAFAAKPPPAVCGNGLVEQGEACDASTLKGATCESAGFRSPTIASASQIVAAASLG